MNLTCGEATRPARRSMEPHMPAHLRSILAALLVTLHASVVLAAEEWKVLWEHWYVLEIAGAKAGSVVERVESDGERYRTTSESEFRISRGTTELEISQSAKFIETHRNEPIEIDFTQSMSKQDVRSIWRFVDDGVEMISMQGGRELKKKEPRPRGAWLTPMGMHALTTERLKAGAERFEFAMISPENGLSPVTITNERTGTRTFTLDGREVPVTVWKQTTSVMPGTTNEMVVSSDGHMVEQRMVLPFGEMVTRLTSRKDAQARAENAPELMMSSFVRPTGKIVDPRALRQLQMRLRAKQGTLPELPVAGAQRVERSGDGTTALLKVDVDAPLEASSAELTDPAYLGSSSMIDPTDDLIIKLARRAVKGAGESPRARATALRAFVHAHISGKALSTAVATASETARTKSGDCSEHGVLLCALLRAQGIPARVAAGLVYADAFANESGIFGWHMWTQALIDGKWIDLDATLPVDYDAAHVLTGATAMGDSNLVDGMNNVLLMMGNLEIEILPGGGDS